jgi:7,8-dihydropterin-6-yl-methyl-4-(beta-D-ribofuranosyl)aminobenzene 5'-phosphate synthase
MNKLLIITFVLIFVNSHLIAEGNKILCLYNNEGDNNSELIIDWGFSALINHDDLLILFDAGASADILEHNCNKLGVNLKDVDIAVLSHKHRDHITGFNYLFEVNPNVKVFLPNDRDLGGGSTPEWEEWNSKYKVGYRFNDADITFVKQNMEIAPGIVAIPTIASSIGVFLKDPTDDQNTRYWGLPEVSIAVKSIGDKWILIDGCSHSGVAKIVDETNKYLETNVDGVVGGFHLGMFSTEQLIQIANKMKNELKVRWVSPTHCTGENGQNIFKDIYQDNYKKFDLGSEISF